MARFRIVVVLVGLVALGLLAYAVASVVLNGGAARSWGWTAVATANGWVVQNVDAAGPAAGLLRPGDRIADMDGIVMVAGYRRGEAAFRSLAAIGDRYAPRVERGGQTLEQMLVIAPGRRVLGTRLVFLFVSLVWCAVGLFIGYSRPEDPVARLAFAAALATASQSRVESHHLVRITSEGTWHVAVEPNVVLRARKQERVAAVGAR